MPGTSTSGVNRLRWWAATAAVGVATVLMVPVPVWAATAQASTFVTVCTDVECLPAVGAGSVPTVVGGHDEIVPTPGNAASGAIVTADPGQAGTAVSGALPGTVSGSTAGVAGAVDASRSGSSTGAATDLSVENAAAPPAAVPWIVGVLLVLVVAGAARAYLRSPQRAAARRSRRPRHDAAG
jgi:hypothetical protein